MLGPCAPNVYLDTSSSNGWMRYEGLDLSRVFRRALDVVGPRKLLSARILRFSPRAGTTKSSAADARVKGKLGISAADARLHFRGELAGLAWG